MPDRKRCVWPRPYVAAIAGLLLIAMGLPMQTRDALGSVASTRAPFDTLDAEGTEPVEPDAPIDLFDGETLDGWVGDTELFEAGDGVLRCKGDGRGVLQTDTDYTGYILTLEWRWPEGADGDTSPGDSGVFLHLGPGEGIGQWPDCIEVQLHHGNAGDFWLLGVTLTPFDADQPQVGGRVSRDPATVENEPGEWNTLTVLCDGGYLEVQVNGETANAGFDASRTHGPIALQCEGDAIDFRNLRLEPLE